MLILKDQGTEEESFQVPKDKVTILERYIRRFSTRNYTEMIAFERNDKFICVDIVKYDLFLFCFN